MDAALAGPAHTLEQERQTAHSLLELLRREQEELMAGRTEELDRLSAEKTALVTHMTTLARTRYAALAAAACDAGENGMRTWLERGAPEAARHLWRDLLALAESARELNRTNGLLIGKQLARNQAALNVLQGTGAGSFYGPDGQSTPPHSSHRFIAG